MHLEGSVASISSCERKDLRALSLSQDKDQMTLAKAGRKTLHGHCLCIWISLWNSDLDPHSRVGLIYSFPERRWNGNLDTYKSAFADMRAGRIPTKRDNLVVLRM